MFGPVISLSLLDQTFCSNKAAFDKILGYVEKAKAAGGQILIGGTGQYFKHAGIVTRY
jgi:acyl-CoA reductase-like NAD-dependent aldehyde dehydrogenase